MPTLNLSRIAELISPFCSSITMYQQQQLSDYLDLLVRWNSKTNLTSIRDPEEMVVRHFGESLFIATHLPTCKTLLDLGSGAGFPGLPIQIFLPDLTVTLAESQNKKATFLREVVRHLGLRTEVWADRAENMPPLRRFDAIVLRAVDNPLKALELARRRVSSTGVVMLLTSGGERKNNSIPLPNSSSSQLQFFTQKRAAETVPRETEGS